jgi:glycosyltransferase involved in cell wall biosynthesis
MVPVGLAMIVRNEAHVIGRLVASVRPLVCAWVVSDTGSTDGTQEAVHRHLGDLPGTLREEPWQDYAANRTALLQAARDSGLAEYWLLLDADETVTADLPLPDLTHDAYMLEMHYPPIRYWVPRLVSSRAPWGYVGYAHEYLDCALPVTVERLPAIRVFHHADGGNRAGKLERELALLRRDDADNPANPRTVFYLARTLEELGRVGDAVAHYERRKRMGGYDEEVWYSWYRIGVLNCGLSLEHPELRRRGIEELLDAYQVRPWRAEPLRALARFYARERSVHLAELFGALADAIPYPHQDSLFIESRP